MAAYDPGHLLDDAEQEMTRAATQAVDAWLTAARADVLGDSGAPNLEGWPAPSVWVRLVDRFLMPVIERLFGEAFAAAARSDLLQIHNHRTQWMTQAHDRLSAALWPDDAYNRIRGVLVEGVDTGASIPQMRAQIADELGTSRYAYVAERIARTEAHAAVEAGTYAAEQEWAASSGEEIFRMWRATPGPRTRAAHAAAHGQVVALDEPFTVGGATLRYPGDPTAPPSLVINCFPGDVSVLVPGGAPAAVFRRWYEGTMVRVLTKHGHEVTGTPNHPLLTDRGWAGLHALKVGDHLVSGPLTERMSGRDPHVEQRPTRLDEVYRTVHEAGVTRRVVGSRVDFHGDRPDGEVEVVRPLLDLEFTRDAARCKCVGDGDLSGLKGREGGSPGACCVDCPAGPTSTRGVLSAEGVPVLPPGSVGSTRVGGSFVKAHAGHAQLVGLADASSLTSGFAQHPEDEGPRDVELAGQGEHRGPLVEAGNDSGRVDVVPPARVTPDVVVPLAERHSGFDEAGTDGVGADTVDPADIYSAFPGGVPTDEVVDVQTFDFAGHVYNLESPLGWYIANGIAVSNCRCTAIYGLADELAELAPEPLSAAGGSMPTEHPLMWRGVLAPLEVRGDFRVLAEPADGKVLTTDLMWLSYQEKSAGGHDGKIAVGRVDRVWIANGMVWGEGPFDASDPAAVEVARKVGERFAGTVSVDLAEGDFELRFYDADDQPITGGVDPAGLEDGTVQELVYVTNWRLGGVTLVQDPAFGTSRDGKASARIWMVEPLEGAMTAAATGNTMLPLAERDHPWDGDAAKRRLADAGRLSAGCFWRDDDADPDSDIQADYRLPFADIVDGELVAVPRGIFSVAGVLQGAMGGVDLPQEAQDAIRDRVEDYYERMAEAWDDPDVRAPWDDEDDDDDEGETMAASAATGTTWAEKVADAVPVHPPKHWFSDPQLTGLTKVRITDEGRVYGHIADWQQTHIGHMGQRVYPPRCPDGGTYPRFHRHPVRTAEGDRINTGPLTTAGHASTDANVTMGAAMAHYDDPRFVLANVVVGEDEHGIWVAGALRPGVEPWQVAFGDTYSFSGDWRNGNLVAACAVSVPGFHLPSDDTVAALAASAGVAPDTAQVRSRVDDGQVVALVSAGVIAPAADQARTLGRQDVHRLLAAIDTSATHVQTLAADIGDTVYTAMRRALADHEADQAIIGQLAADLGVE